jgi:hypothetical protein
MLVVLDAVGVSMSISTFLGGGVSKDEGIRSASGGDTNLPVTAFLASGVLGPAITLPRGVPVPLPRLGAVGGGVTSSSSRARCRHVLWSAIDRGRKRVGRNADRFKMSEESMGSYEMRERREL